MMYDLLRLKHASHNLTLNFERMRPVYLYLIEQPLGDYEMAEAAYRKIGGDAFAISLEKDKENEMSFPSRPRTSGVPPPPFCLRVWQGACRGGEVR